MLFHPYRTSVKRGGIISTFITLIPSGLSSLYSLCLLVPFLAPILRILSLPSNHPPIHPLTQYPICLSLSLFPLSFWFQNPRAIMAARGPTRTTVARGSATSTAGVSPPQTTQTPIHPIRSVFTSWKVKPDHWCFIFCSIAPEQLTQFPAFQRVASFSECH